MRGGLPSTCEAAGEGDLATGSLSWMVRPGRSPVRRRPVVSVPPIVDLPAAGSALGGPSLQGSEEDAAGGVG